MASDVGTMFATWTDPDGAEWPLSGPDPVHGWLTPPGPAGWGAAPVTIVTDPQARGGEVVRTVRTNPRRLTWPLHIHGDTHLEFLTRYRRLMAAFTNTTVRQRPGVLRVARPDGSARQIDAWYEDGFGGEAGENWVSANPVLTLFCPDGYWRGTTEHVVERQFSVGVPFLTNYPTISASQVLGATVVHNPGEVHAWPVWTITGPAASLTATNVTRGEMFALAYNLPAGQTITITSDRPTIRGPSGQNLVDTLDWPASVLWPLDPLDNEVNFQVGGASSGTRIRLAFHPRYEAS